MRKSSPIIPVILVMLTTFLLYKNLCGQQAVTAQASQELDAQYMEARRLYVTGDYDLAILKLKSILKALDLDPSTRYWRMENKAKPTEEQISRLIDMIEESKVRDIEARAGKELQQESLQEQARVEAERRARQAQLAAQKEFEERAREEALARQREEQARNQAAMLANRQEAQLYKALTPKQEEDQAKIEKIEQLWKQAIRKYNSGMYEAAIVDFKEIVMLEGNPRVKYSPYAEKLISKSQSKIAQVKKAEYDNDINSIENEMMYDVQKQQILPYLEPPVSQEEAGSVPLVQPPVVRKKLKAVKITIDFDKVGLKSVMSFLSQESGVNFVASQKVLELSPVVSVHFKDAPLDEATKYITKSLGLVYRIDHDVVWIALPDEVANEAMETRVYYLNRGGGLFTEFTPITATTSETGLGGSSAQVSKIYTIEDTIKEIVPWPQDAKLTYDKRLNALVVRNTPQNLQILEDVLYDLDVVPCQVLIEAKFMELDVTDIKDLGFEWKFTGEDFPTQLKGGGVKQGFVKDSGIDFSAFTRAAEGLNFDYAGVLTTPQFQAVMHALSETKKIKTLSSPRITTLNNQMASIKVVDEWIYPTRYEYEIVQFDRDGDGDFDGAGETFFQNVPKDFLRRDVGILLKVIPAVGADRKTISLSLIPEVSEAKADVFVYTGDVKLPQFTSRNLSTTVVVNSGDTVVLGGLIKENRTHTITRVPILGDIPLFGAFFRKNADTIERKNLIIFVTAKVLTAGGEEVVSAK